jgi:hypothetical protein
MARSNSLNISRLSKYNFKFISIEEVIILEYLIAYHQKGSLDVVVPNRIELETGIRRNKIINATELLSEKGFLEIKIDKNRTQYSLSLENIINSLNKLFVKENKYSMQFFYFVQNPYSFKKRSKIRKSPQPVETPTPVAVKRENKPKAPAKVAVVQTSLF